MEKSSLAHWGVLLLSFSGLNCAEAANDLSVCQVLENLDKFRGKTVTLHGAITGNDQHGYYLRDSERACHSKRKLFLNGKIKLFVSQDPEMRNPNRRFETDTSAFDAAVQEAKRIWSAHPGTRTMVTISGEIVTPKHPFVICDSPDVCWGNRYGLGGRCQVFCVNILAGRCFGSAILAAPERRVGLCGDAT